jgi:hypothetical protein
MRVPSRCFIVLFCTAIGSGACSDPAAPPPAPPTLTVQGTVFDSLGNPVSGALVDVYPDVVYPSNPSGFGLGFSDIMTDSVGQYHVHYDSLSASVDRIAIRTTPPGCYDGTQITTVDIPSVPALGPHAVTQDVVLTSMTSPATSAVGRFCALVSDEGLFGYSGWLTLFIDQSNVVGTAGDWVFSGKWTIGWSPTYGGSDGTFLGAQVASRVGLELRDTTGIVTCPPVHWEGSVDSAGSWGILTPTIEGGGTCRWANFPVKFTEDTASGSWP